MKKSWSIAGLLASFVLPLMRATMARRAPIDQLQVSQIAKGLRCIAALVLLPFLFVVSSLTCASVASAQTKPDWATAAWSLGGVLVTWQTCDIFNPEQDQTTTNCAEEFSIYRTPGFNQSPVEYPVPWPPTSVEYQWTDTTVKKGQSYTYEVCTGASANSTKSNCYTTNMLSPPPPPPPSKPTVTLNASNPYLAQKKSGSLWDTTLSWTSTNATGLNLEPMNGSDTSLGEVPPTGSKSVDIPGSPTTYVITATNVVGTATAQVTVSIPTPCPSFAPPQNLKAMFPYAAELRWTNPSTSPNTPYQACPSSPTDVVIYRMGGTVASYEQLADLPANNGLHSTRYDDPGPLLPHTEYWYSVCEGPAVAQPNGSNNCSGVSPYTWGAAPVLTATRLNATTVQLQIAVDQFNVTSISVTRGVVDNVCIKGQKLANGLMGCPTVHTLPNGTIVPGPPVTTCPGGCTPATCPLSVGMISPVYAGPMVTVYNWTQIIGSTPNWTFASKTAPYLIDLPNDTTVQLGTEYYYQAEVAWATGNVEDSDNVTVPTTNDVYAQQAALGSGLKPLKLSGGTSGSSQSGTVATPMTAPMLSPTRTITPAASSPMMAQAGATAAPPPQQSATAARPMIAPMVAPTAPMPQSARPTSSAGTTAAPPSQSATAASPMMAPMLSRTSPTAIPAATSPMMLPAGTTAQPSQSTAAVRLAIAPMAGGVSIGSAGTCPPPAGMGTRSAMLSMARTASPIMQRRAPTTAAPPQQSAATARPMMAPMIAPTTSMLQPGRPMMSSTGPAAAQPLTQSATGTRRTIAPMSVPTSRMAPSVRSSVVASAAAANLNAAISQVQQQPRDAQALYALGKAYCASHLKDTGVSYMYMALLLAEQAHDATLVSQIKTSLAGQGVSAEE